MMNDKITRQKLDKYFEITSKALELCRNKLNSKKLKESKDFLDMSEIAKKISSFTPDSLMISEHDQKMLRELFFDMAQRYYSDAQYFMKKDDYVLAFAALNYAHGWLDAGARIKLFNVHDSKLFTVDDE